MNFFKPKMEENHKEYFYVEIIAGSIYFAFGVVVITVYKDRSFDFITKVSPVANLIKKEANIKSIRKGIR